MNRSRGISSELVSLLALAVAVAFAIPVLWMFAASLKPEQAIHEDLGSPRSFVTFSPTSEHYIAAIRRGDVSTTLVNTFVAVALIALGGLCVNAPAAYAFARMRFPGRELIFLLLVMTIIIPLEVIVIPLFLTVRPTRSLTAVLDERVWTLGALSIPFMAKAFNIFLLRQQFLSLPRSLEEAAFLDGAGWWRTFWHVALPNVRPAIVTVLLLDFVVHWNDFLWPLVVCQRADTRTVQLGLANFFTQPPILWGAVMAYGVLATIPMLVALVLGQRWIVRSLLTTGLKQ
ncbi:MAG: carbohydrate ABC transporter permease [Phycisphaerales bacterium]|nr:MAG: carbohydrate ABC transporter permease [Phycisphaerales bacterium]